MNLENIIDKKFSGIIAISDIHAVHDLFLQAVDFAKSNNLFILFLGDLVDTGHQPYEVVMGVKELTDNNLAVLSIGNHDDKYHRYHKGNQIALNEYHLETLYRVGHDRLDSFLKSYSNLITSANANSYFYYGNTFFAHAGLSESFYDKPAIVEKKDKRITMFGEVSGNRFPNGFPERLYDWVELVPTEYILVVGHDRAPYNINLQGTPRIVSNSNNGKVFFTDTGCGKNGHLTGSVFIIKNGELLFKTFQSFK